jgi:nucleotide-binding universal stress UspA family protein
MHVRHILVAVDLSPLSERAVDEAIRWTRAFRGEITRVTLFHVDETPSLSIGNATSVLDLMTKVAHARSEHLGHLAKRLSETGVEVGVEVAAGLPHEEILSAVTRLSADWLVIARRKNGEEGFLLGSTTKRILRKINCPVLVCNGLDDDQTATIDHTKLIVTTDFSDYSVHGLQEAADLAKRLNASLTAVHALRLPILVPFLPGEFPLQIPQDSLAHLSAVQQGELDTWIATNAPRHQTINTRLVIGSSIANAISDFALSQHAGLIVVAAQGKGAFTSFFLGSTTQSLAERVPCAVLVLPSKEQHAA